MLEDYTVRSALVSGNEVTWIKHRLTVYILLVSIIKPSVTQMQLCCASIYISLGTCNNFYTNLKNWNSKIRDHKSAFALRSKYLKHTRKIFLSSWQWKQMLRVTLMKRMCERAGGNHKE